MEPIKKWNQKNGPKIKMELNKNGTKIKKARSISRL